MKILVDVTLLVNNFIASSTLPHSTLLVKKLQVYGYFRCEITLNYCTYLSWTINNEILVNCTIERIFSTKINIDWLFSNKF